MATILVRGSGDVGSAVARVLFKNGETVVVHDAPAPSYTRRGIGDEVKKGQEVARIGDAPLLAPLTGCLRGLTHDGVTVQVDTKVIEVDPRGQKDAAREFGERPLRIAEGVLAVVKAVGMQNCTGRQC